MEEKMANKRFLFGMLIITLVLSAAGTACSGSTGGTFTLTDIPSRFNGKYVILESAGTINNSGDFLIGANKFNVQDWTGTLPRISNGIVTIPMWIVNEDETEIVRYNGNHRAGIDIVLFEKAEIKDEIDYDNLDIAEIFFDNVSFSNGSAKVSFQDHDDIWE